MILRNAVVGWGSMGLNIALALITTPLLIHYLGVADYGLWLIAMGVGGFLILLDLGLTWALQRRVAADLAVADLSSLQETLSTSLSLYLLIGFVTLIIYWLLALAPQLVFKIPPDRIEAMQWVFIPMGVSSALSAPVRYFESLLVGREKHYILGLTTMTASAVRFVAVVVLLMLGGGLARLALLFSFLLCVEYLVVVVVASRSIANLGLRIFTPGFRPERARALFSYGRRALMIQMSRALRQQGMALILGALATPLGVARFGVGMRMHTYAIDLVTTATFVFQPRFSSLEAKGELDEMKALFMRATIYTSLLSAYLGLGLLLLGSHFIRLWVGAAFEVSEQVVVILAAPVMLFMSLRPCEVALVGVGRHGMAGWVSLGECLVLLTGCYFMIPLWGPLGAAWAMTVSFLLIRPWLIPTKTCRVTGLALSRFWLRGVFYSWLCLLPAGLTLYLLLAYRTPAGWVEFVLFGTLYTLLAGLSVWVLALDGEERAFWLDKFRDLFRSRT